jgi:hypothetical protein
VSHTRSESPQDQPEISAGKGATQPSALADVDNAWLEEAERRLEAHRGGRVQGIPAEDVVGAL